jgi:hypothetical protein
LGLTTTALPFDLKHPPPFLLAWVAFGQLLSILVHNAPHNAVHVANEMYLLEPPHVLSEPCRCITNMLSARHIVECVCFAFLSMRLYVRRSLARRSLILVYRCSFAWLVSILSCLNRVCDTLLLWTVFSSVAIFLKRHE